jgi:hypothetical protein
MATPSSSATLEIDLPGVGRSAELHLRLLFERLRFLSSGARLIAVVIAVGPPLPRRRWGGKEDIRIPGTT